MRAEVNFAAAGYFVSDDDVPAQLWWSDRDRPLLLFVLTDGRWPFFQLPFESLKLEAIGRLQAYE
jgi:hypothetical protein